LALLRREGFQVGRRRLLLKAGIQIGMDGRGAG
jgi:hypothetical protein